MQKTPLDGKPGCFTPNHESLGVLHYPSIHSVEYMCWICLVSNLFTHFDKNDMDKKRRGAEK